MPAYNFRTTPQRTASMFEQLRERWQTTQIQTFIILVERVWQAEFGPHDCIGWNKTSGTNTNQTEEPHDPRE